MRVTVDLMLCQGHGQCHEAAPEVFEVRDDGFAHVLIEDIQDPALLVKAEEAISRCPVEAISAISR